MNRATNGPTGVGSCSTHVGCHPAGSVALLFVAVLFETSTSHAQTFCSVHYDASLSTLPQAQSWMLENQGFIGPEPVVVDGALFQSTNFAGYQYWYRDDFDRSFDWTTVIEFELRILYSNQGGTGLCGWSLYLADDVGRVYVVGIATNVVVIVPNGYTSQRVEAPFQASGEFQRFHFVAGPTGGTVFADGVALVTIPPADRVDAYLPRRILFGDGTNSAANETFVRYVRATTIAIIRQPHAHSVCPMGTLDFSVLVAGTGPFAYEWRRNGVPLDPLSNPSAATATLTLTNVQPTDAGPYDCVVSNACGSVTSSAATLSVCDYAGDTNCDAIVDLVDLATQLSNFGMQFGATRAEGDANGDGAVDLTDLAMLLSQFGSGCP